MSIRKTLIFFVIILSLSVSQAIAMTSVEVDRQAVHDDDGEREIIVRVADAKDIHSVNCVFSLPEGVEYIRRSHKLGPFMRQRGGSVLPFSEQKGRMLHVSLALLGTSHDVSGAGELIRFRVSSHINSTPVEIVTMQVMDTAGVLTEITDFN